LLARERRVHLADKPIGYLGTVVVGLAFGAGWTPCIGPILGSILIYTSNSADLGRGLGLLAAYSMGLAVPFLGASLAINHFLSFFTRVRTHVLWVSRAGGVLLILVGVLLLTDYFTVLAGYLQRLTPDAIRNRI
jgi:cytochrome c-type biogenesis protein